MTYAGNHEPQLPHYLYFYHLNLQIKKNHFPAKIIHHKIQTHTSQAGEKKTITHQKLQKVTNQPSPQKQKEVSNS